jgi:hypothetical protein
MEPIMKKILIISTALASLFASNAMAGNRQDIRITQNNQTTNQIFYDCDDDAPCGQLAEEEIWIDSKHIHRVYK